MFVVDQLDMGVWEWYGNYPTLGDAKFAVMEAEMQDHLEDSHYEYRIVEHIEHYRSFE